MQFKPRTFLKHKKGIDAFIQIMGTLWTVEKGTSYVGYWMIQGINNHWHGTKLTPIWVSNEEKDNWSSYTPTGELL